MSTEQHKVKTSILKYHFNFLIQNLFDSWHYMYTFCGLFVNDVGLCLGSQSFNQIHIKSCMTLKMVCKVIHGWLNDFKRTWVLWLPKQTQIISLLQHNVWGVVAVVDNWFTLWISLLGLFCILVKHQFFCLVLSVQRRMFIFILNLDTTSQLHVIPNKLLYVPSVCYWSFHRYLIIAYCMVYPCWGFHVFKNDN